MKNAYVSCIYCRYVCHYFPSLIATFDEFAIAEARDRARISLGGRYLVQPALCGEPGPNPAPKKPEDQAGTTEFSV